MKIYKGNFKSIRLVHDGEFLKITMTVIFVLYTNDVKKVSGCSLQAEKFTSNQSGSLNG